MVCHYASTCHARLPHFPFKYSSQIPDLLHLMWTCQQIPCAHHGQEFPSFEGSSKFISPWLHWPAFKLESIIWIFLSFFIVWGNDFLWSQTIRTPCESRFARKIASNSRLEGKEGSWPSQSKAFLKTVGSKQMSRQEFLWIHILGIWKGIISLFGSRMQRRNRCKLRSFKGPDGWVTDHKKRSSNTLVPCIAASSSWLLIENAADAVIHAYTYIYIYIRTCWLLFWKERSSKSATCQNRWNYITWNLSNMSVSCQGSRIKTNKSQRNVSNCLYNIFWSLLNGANPEPTSLQQYARRRS